MLHRNDYRTRHNRSIWMTEIGGARNELGTAKASIANGSTFVISDDGAFYPISYYYMNNNVN